MASSCGSRKEPQHRHWPPPHPDSVAESFLNVGNVIERCQDTSRARVQVVRPRVGDLSVAQVLNPGDLLPCTLERVLQAPETDQLVVKAALGAAVH